MTEQVTTVNDIAAMLNAEGNEPEQSIDEPTGATDRVEEAIAADDTQTSEAVEELEDGGENEEALDDDDEQRYYAKVDGEDVEVTIEEALNGYQRDQDYRKKTMALAEDKKLVAARGAEIDSKLVELDSFIKRTEDETDWQELQDTDPREYIRRKDELEKAKGVASEALEARNKEMKEQQDAFVSQESAKLIEHMGGDSWTAEQRNVDMKLANDYLIGIGWTEAEIAGINSYPAWRVIFDASKAQNYKATEAKVKDQVRKAPKSVKPGQPVPSSVRKRQAAMKKVKGANKHNSTEALADFLNL